MALVRNASLGIINVSGVMIAPGATAQVDEKETGTLIKRGKLVRVREGDRADPEPDAATPVAAAAAAVSPDPVAAPPAPAPAPEPEDDGGNKRSSRRA